MSTTTDPSAPGAATADAVNAVTWFEIGTDDVTAAREFYGGLFSWTFQADHDSPDYLLISAPGSAAVQGGLADTGGRTPNYAVFYVQVRDVPATVVAAQARGGAVVVPPQTMPDGLVFARLRDPSGNHFAVYTPPAVR